MLLPWLRRLVKVCQTRRQFQQTQCVKLTTWHNISGGSKAEPYCHHEQAEWSWCVLEVALAGVRCADVDD